MDGRSAAAALGVGQTATKDDIRRAFRARAKLAHPDTVGSDEAFIALRAAFELLLPLAPDESSGRGVASRQPNAEWLSMPGERARSTIDRRDRCDGHRTPTRPSSARRPGASRPTAVPPRDARGLTFEDHLAVALAGR